MIALLVGVLPAIANHDSSAVKPTVIDFGGGSGGCAFVGSVAGNELHINNPASGNFTGPDGTQFTITKRDRVFDFTVLSPGMAVYDVTVNGGTKSNHYDYDGILGDPVTSDVDLHAPRNPQGTPHNLSHVNICYDLNTQFECGVAETREQDGLFTLATVEIFVNSLHDCEDKLGAFVVDNTADDPNVTVDFGTGEGVVAGKATYTKDFGDPSLFEPLEYQRTASDPFVDVEWCNVRAKAQGDGIEFDDFLGTTNYPSLDGVTDAGGPAIACKVYEEEDATGIQFTVVYFEFEDPNFR